MLMYRVQIELPPYPDYESLVRKLTLAVECVSVPTRPFRFIYPIFPAGRQLGLIENRGYLAYFWRTSPLSISGFEFAYPLMSLLVLALSPISVL